jgi:hypothetical protein
VSDAGRRRKLVRIEQILGPALWHSSIADADGSGFTTPKAIVEAELFQLEQRCAALERMRSRGSKSTKRAMKQFAAALEKAKRLPEDLRQTLKLDDWTIDRMVDHLVAYEKHYVSIPATADAQREAARSALYLCETFEIPPLTTRARIDASGETIPASASVFCRLAAALYDDDPNDETDMQPYCRELLRERRER